jgi:hypothetical protein
VSERLRLPAALRAGEWNNAIAASLWAVQPIGSLFQKLSGGGSWI